MSADIYSIGAIFYYMLKGKDPPDNVLFDESKKPIFDGVFYSSDAKDLLNQMMNQSPDERISLKGF